LGLINDILDMSRIESGRVTLKNEEFSFREFLDQINIIINGQCVDKGLVYHCSIVGNVSDFYYGDDMKMKQVLINILGNAVKFTPRGGSVVLTCEETASLKGNATIRFVMSDTGIGMSSEFLPRIFDTFSQEKTSSSNSYGSTGLGMAITKNFVELMNGSIDVESEKNVGTVFTVTVPLRRSALMTSAEKSAQKKSALQHSELHNDGIAGSEKKIKKQKAELNGRRLLLAEDVEVNAQIMMMVLEARGITAELAVNGKIAVQMFKLNEPGYYDAILMDMRMPEMDGLTATREIRKSGKADAETIPIIALTANAFDEDVQRSLQAGLNAHLAKPVEPDTLYGALETLIKE
jgi:CheY-like chemotaxis protein